MVPAVLTCLAVPRFLASLKPRLDTVQTDPPPGCTIEGSARMLPNTQGHRDVKHIRTFGAGVVVCSTGVQVPGTADTLLHRPSIALSTSSRSIEIRVASRMTP